MTHHVHDNFVHFGEGFRVSFSGVPCQVGSVELVQKWHRTDGLTEAAVACNVDCFCGRWCITCSWKRGRTGDICACHIVGISQLSFDCCTTHNTRFHAIRDARVVSVGVGGLARDIQLSQSPLAGCMVLRPGGRSPKCVLARRGKDLRLCGLLARRH